MWWARLQPELMLLDAPTGGGGVMEAQIGAQQYVVQAFKILVLTPRKARVFVDTLEWK